MKILKKIGFLVATGAMAVGVGVAVSSTAHQDLRTDATAGSVGLSKGVFTATSGDVKAHITWAETYWTVVQQQGLSGTAVNQNYITAPRMYKGHYLSFEAPTGITFDSISITCTGYIGSDVTYGASTSSGLVPAGDAKAKPTNKTGDLTAVTPAGTSTITTPDLASAKSVFIQNSYGDASSYTQLRPTAITINYTSSIVNVDPESLSVSFGSSTLTTLGATTQATATVLPADTTDKSVTWSSDNTSVAVVAQTGVVTALSNGTANITATSNVKSSVYNSSQITVNATAESVYDKTVVASNAASAGMVTSGYPTALSYVNIDGVLYGYDKFYAPTGKTYIQGQSGAGHLFNTATLNSDIKTITIVLNADGTAPFTLNVGSALGSVTTTLTPAVTGAINVYSAGSSGMRYFDIGTLTGTAYILSLTIEFVNSDVEAARSLATTMLSDFATYCVFPYEKITDELWNGYVSSYSALSSVGKDAFSNELGLASVTGIQKVIPTYKYIVSIYGRTNFMNLTISSVAVTNVMNENQSATAIPIIIGVTVLSLSALAFTVIFRKKKAE